MRSERAALPSSEVPLNCARHIVEKHPCENVEGLRFCLQCERRLFPFVIVLRILAESLWLKTMQISGRLVHSLRDGIEMAPAIDYAAKDDRKNGSLSPCYPFACAPPFLLSRAATSRSISESPCLIPLKRSSKPSRICCLSCTFSVSAFSHTSVPGPSRVQAS